MSHRRRRGGANRRLVAGTASHVKVRGHAKLDPSTVQIDGDRVSEVAREKVQELQWLVRGMCVEGAHLASRVVRKVLIVVFKFLGMSAHPCPFGLTSVHHMSAGAAQVSRASDSENACSWMGAVRWKWAKQQGHRYSRTVAAAVWWFRAGVVGEWQLSVES